MNISGFFRNLAVTVILLLSADLQAQSSFPFSGFFHRHRTEMSPVNTVSDPRAISVVDDYVHSLKRSYKSIDELAADLTKPFHSDEEKVRAIFRWMTENIAYDCPLYHKQGNEVVFYYHDQKDLNEKRKKFYFDYATNVLKSKRGICEGYSSLFRELCTSAGIECEIVVGRADSDVAKIHRLSGKKTFATNHTWNKVKISGEWYYLDATWASGYCDAGVHRFYREYNPDYYLTPVSRPFPTHLESIPETTARNN